LKVWHDLRTAPKEGDIRCKSCGLNKHVLLVMQVYAPVEQYHRSLYVFCCNTRSCSMKSAGWIVIRNQRRIDDGTIGTIPCKPNNVSELVTHSIPIISKINKSFWDDDGCDDMELNRLLIERDLKLLDGKKNSNEVLEEEIDQFKIDVLDSTTCTDALNKCTTSIGARDGIHSNDMTSLYITDSLLPYYDIIELDEEWEKRDELLARGGDDDSSAVLNFSDQQHMKQLLESYFEGEENMEVVDIVSSAFNGSHKGTSNVSLSNVSSIEGEENVVIDDDYGDDGNDDVENAIQSSLSRSTMACRTEAYFQRRVSYYPHQVLRYAYGGEPLWITYPSPLAGQDCKEPVVLLSQDTSNKIQQFKIGNSSNNNNYNNNNNGKDITSKGDKRSNSSKTKKKKISTVSSKINERVSKLDHSSQSIDSMILHSPTSSVDILIPRCQLCGSMRVFECQLMPALLSLIDQHNINITASRDDDSMHPDSILDKTAVDEHISIMDMSSSTHMHHMKRLKESLGTGLDFGVVAIWSCPNSCDIPTDNKYTMEIAVVQLPSDISSIH